MAGIRLREVADGMRYKAFLFFMKLALKTCDKIGQVVSPQGSFVKNSISPEIGRRR